MYQFILDSSLYLNIHKNFFLMILRQWFYFLFSNMIYIRIFQKMQHLRELWLLEIQNNDFSKQTMLKIKWQGYRIEFQILPSDDIIVFFIKKMLDKESLQSNCWSPIYYAEILSPITYFACTKLIQENKLINIQLLSLLKVV